MTAVASPPVLAQHNRSAWGINHDQARQSSLDPMNPDELDRMFTHRKSLQRNNSSSSISSTSSTSSASTVSTTSTQPPTNGAPMPANGDLSSWSNSAPAARKRPQPKAPWPGPKAESNDFVRMTPGGRPQLMTGINGSGPMQSQSLQSPAQQQGMQRPLGESMAPGGQPVLYLLSLNGTFERKTISVPFSPDTLRIGRQTNAKTVPTPVNGFFDSKVLSRQHAEIWADRQGKVWIRDVKSSNGTFVNGTRLSQENRESEPHELQTSDHLELGIDIVSEDQKTVVHHKVAAKVEHAGFLNTPNNLLDMNFGDLDPSNGAMMLPNAGLPPYRARPTSSASVGANMRTAPGTMANPVNGVGAPRGGFFFSPISTEQIVKRLQSELRTARLQTHDLTRTGQFVDALLTKDLVKDLDKVEAPDPPRSQIVNGNGISFRADGSKTRFSDPPAPPPQQPLPEKPDVPSLKRGTTERPKSQFSNSNNSPVRQDGSTSQILLLTEELSNAKREIESQTHRMRELEEKLFREIQARELAEDLAKRLEDQASSKVNGALHESQGDGSMLDVALDPSLESPVTADVETPTTAKDGGRGFAESQAEVAEVSTTHLQSQLDSMVSEMKDLRTQLEAYQRRAETAESERDADRKTLAEQALLIRREAEARESAARAKLHGRASSRSIEAGDDASDKSSVASGSLVRTPSTDSNGGQSTPGGQIDHPTLSRANTITALTGSSGKMPQDQLVLKGMPYASMMGVVLIGIGLMAYINGWQTQPSRLDQ